MLDGKKNDKNRLINYKKLCHDKFGAFTAASALILVLLFYHNFITLIPFSVYYSNKNRIILKFPTKRTFRLPIAIPLFLHLKSVTICTIPVKIADVFLLLYSSPLHNSSYGPVDHRRNSDDIILSWAKPLLPSPLSFWSAGTSICVSYSSWNSSSRSCLKSCSPSPASAAPQAPSPGYSSHSPHTGFSRTSSATVVVPM